MAAPLMSEVARDYVTDGIPSSGVHEIRKRDLRSWGAWIEQIVTAFISNGGVIYASKAALDADLAKAANTMAWVVEDATAANNGVYRKVGASGAGSWVRAADLPYSFIVASDVGAGTPDAIQATSSLPVSGAALVLLNIFEANTTSPVTVSFNGGSPLTIKTNSGNDVAAGGLQSGMLVVGRVSGSTFRLVSDQASAAILAAAEAAADRAEAAAVGVADAIAFPGSFGKELAADGIANDVPALIALESAAEEVIRLKNATYFIGTNYTPTKTLRFSSGTKFLIAEGVTVDFSQAEPEIHAPKKQRFYFAGAGTGAVTNLEISYAGWFAGDKLNVASNALPELKKWAESVATRGICKVQRGDFYTDGSDHVEFSKGQSVEGHGRDASKLRFLGTETRGFKFSTVSRPSVEKIGFQTQNGLVAPTVGEVVLFEAGCLGWRAQALMTSGVYTALKSFAGNGKLTQFDFYDTRHSGLNFEDCADDVASQGIIAATSSWLVLTGITGTFVSEAITWSGGSGSIFPGAGSNFKGIFGETSPAPGTVITGSTSGATATVSSIMHPHIGGGIRIRNQGEAHLYSDIDVVGGDYPLLIDAANDLAYQRALTCVFTGCLFDSGKTAGAFVSKALGIRFLGCWFSNRPAEQDAYVTASEGVEFIACQWTNTWGRCLTVDGSCRDVNVIGGFATDFNNRNVAGTWAISYGAGSSGTVRDFKVLPTSGYGGNLANSVGISIAAGSTVLIDNVDVSLCGTPIVDSSGGTAQLRNVRGYKTTASGAATMPTSGSVVINHGLGKAPVKVIITPQGDPQVRYFAPPANYTATQFTVACNAAPAAAWNFVWEASTYQD